MSEPQQLSLTLLLLPLPFPFPLPLLDRPRLSAPLLLLLMEHSATEDPL